MRLSLKPKGRGALERLHEHCIAINGNAEPALGPFLERLLCALEKALTKEQWDSIADQLTSEAVKRRRKKQLLLALSEKVDVSDIESFAKKVAKKQSVLNSDSGEKQLISADSQVKT